MNVVARLGVAAIAAAALTVPALVPAHAGAQTTTVAQQTQHVTMYIFGGKQKLMGPDGNPHDTTVPVNFVVKAGVPVVVTVVNYDEGPHTITAPDLKLDAVIKGGHELKDGTVEPVATTFSFTPTKKGNFRWYCKLPCDAGHGYWAMTTGYAGPDKEGFMAGEIVVI